MATSETRKDIFLLNSIVFFSNHRSRKHLRQIHLEKKEDPYVRIRIYDVVGGIANTHRQGLRSVVQHVYAVCVSVQHRVQI